MYQPFPISPRYRCYVLINLQQQRFAVRRYNLCRSRGRWRAHISHVIDNDQVRFVADAAKDITPSRDPMV